MKKLLFAFVLFFSVSLALLPSPFAYAMSDNIQAKACILVDYNTGKVLYEQNANDKYPVASIVKLMTILLTLESIESGNISIDDKVVASASSSSMGGSQVFIEEGGEYLVGDLLKSVIISSANDASVLLAETIAGSEENFVTLMNEKVRALGLENTNYANCTGLPAPNQYSSAKDCAMILKEVSKHSLYHKYSNIWIDKLSHPKGRETELVNTNKLIRYYKGCVGGKTGSTGEAGYCLSAVASRGGMKLIAVVLGTETSKERFAQTSKLFDYGFATFENKKIIEKGKPIDSLVSVSGGKNNKVTGVYAEDFYYVCNKTDKQEIITEIKIEKQIKAPIRKGDKLGCVYIAADGKVIGEVDIIANEDVAKVTIIDNLSKIAENYFL